MVKIKTGFGDLEVVGLRTDGFNYFVITGEESDGSRRSWMVTGPEYETLLASFRREQAQKERP